MVLSLKGFAADLADMFPFLAVSHIMFAERAGAAENLPTEATIEKRRLRAALVGLSFLSAARVGSASLLRSFGRWRGRKTQF